MKRVATYFGSRNSTTFTHCFAVERLRHSELSRENGGILVESVPVNTVNTKDNGNTESGFVYSCSLQFISVIAENVKIGAESFFCPFESFFTGHEFISELHHLTYLFLVGHKGKEGICTLGRSIFRIFVIYHH